MATAPRDLHAGVVGALGWLAASAALALLDRLGFLGPIPGFVLAFALVAGVVTLSATGAARFAPRAWEVVVGLLVGLPLAWGGWQLAAPPAVCAAMAGLGLILPGAWLGAAFGRGIQRPEHFWPLVLVAVGADIASVGNPSGPTRMILEGQGPVALHYIALSMTVPGGGVAPLLGIGDIVFTALLLGAVIKLGLPLRRVLVGLAIGFALCLLGLLVFAIPLPALPFLGPAAALALGRRVKPERGEMLLAFAVIAVLVGLSLIIPRPGVPSP